jgi:hypothetical protein
MPSGYLLWLANPGSGKGTIDEVAIPKMLFALFTDFGKKSNGRRVALMARPCGKP